MEAESVVSSQNGTHPEGEWNGAGREWGPGNGLEAMLHSRSTATGHHQRSGGGSQIAPSLRGSMVVRAAASTASSEPPAAGDGDGEHKSRDEDVWNVLHACCLDPEQEQEQEQEASEALIALLHDHVHMPLRVYI